MQSIIAPVAVFLGAPLLAALFSLAIRHARVLHGLNLATMTGLVEPVGQSHALQEIDCRAAALGRYAGGHLGDQDVVDGRHITQQVEVLKHETDVLAAILVPLLGAESG